MYLGDWGGALSSTNSTFSLVSTNFISSIKLLFNSGWSLYSIKGGTEEGIFSFSKSFISFCVVDGGCGAVRIGVIIGICCSEDLDFELKNKK